MNAVLTGPLFGENTPAPPERRRSRSRERRYSRSSDRSDARNHSQSRSGSWGRNEYEQASSSSHGHSLYSEDQIEESEVEGSEDFDQSYTDLESANLLLDILDDVNAKLYTILVEDDPWLIAGLATAAFFLLAFSHGNKKP